MRVVLVTGSRDFEDRNALFDALDIIKPDLVLHGGAPGADELAGTYAIVRDTKWKVFKAEWTLYGKPAGPIRNHEMVGHAVGLEKAGHHVEVAAFPLPQSRGTRHTIEIAKRAGLHVNIFETD